VEQAKAEVRRLDITPEELATARVNLDNQLRAFVAKAEEAKRARDAANRIVAEPEVRQETVVEEPTPKEIVVPIAERSVDEIYLAFVKTINSFYNARQAREALVSEIGRLPEQRKKDLTRFVSVLLERDVKPRDLVDAIWKQRRQKFLLNTRRICLMRT